MQNQAYRTLPALAYVVVLILLACSSDNSSDVSDTPSNVQIGGALQMTSNDTRINIREVDAPPGHGSTAGPYFEMHSQPATQAEMKSQLGGIRVSSNLPSGFAISESVIMGPAGSGQVASSVYFNTETKLQLIVREHKGGRAHPAIKQGHSRPVSVNSQPGYLITGGWVQLIKDGVTHPLTWDADAKLQLLFQIDDRVFVATVGPNPVSKGFSDTDLISFAESLVPYEGS